jgi:hypothetical protein
MLSARGCLLNEDVPAAGRDYHPPPGGRKVNADKSLRNSPREALPKPLAMRGLDEVN